MSAITQKRKHPQKTESRVPKTESRGSKTERWCFSPTALIICITIISLCQKTFTVDFLTKKTKKNEGEVPQYYVENSHPAIVSPEEWQFVQNEFIRRKRLKGKYRSAEPLSSHIVCGDCGSFYGSKVWHSTDQYRKVIWQCNCKFDHHCKTPTLNENEIKDAFVEALNCLIEGKEQVFEDTRQILKTVDDFTEMDRKLTELYQEMDVVSELTQRCIRKSSVTVQDQKEITREYDALVERYEKAKSQAAELTAQKKEKKARADGISGFIFKLSELGLQEEFDSELWLTLLDVVTVSRDGTKEFSFVNGSKITV